MENELLTVIWFVLSIVTIYFCTKLKKDRDNWRSLAKARGDQLMNIATKPIFNIGDKVIIRGNDWSQDLMIATIIDYTNFGKENTTLLPLVREESTGKEYISFGLMKKYTKEKLEALNKLSPIEQWNVLSENLVYEKGA